MVCGLIAGCVRLREQQDQMLAPFEPSTSTDDTSDDELFGPLICLASCGLARVRSVVKPHKSLGLVLTKKPRLPRPL
jgi:hypothetical protein